MFESRPVPLLPLRVGFAFLEEALPNVPWGAPYISVIYTAPRNRGEKALFSSGRHGATRDNEENAKGID